MNLSESTYLNLRRREEFLILVLKPFQEMIALLCLKIVHQKCLQRKSAATTRDTRSSNSEYQIKHATPPSFKHTRKPHCFSSSETSSLSIPQSQSQPLQTHPKYPHSLSDILLDKVKHVSATVSRANSSERSKVFTLRIPIHAVLCCCMNLWTLS